MRTSAAGVAFVESNEGFAAVPYDDGGRLAWGFGHDQRPGEVPPAALTRQEAEVLLLADLATRFEPATNAAVAAADPPGGCSQAQFDALVDFCYNEGPRNLSIMLSHGWAQVPQQMPRWCYEEVKGVMVVSPGLAARRAAEARMFTGA